MMEVDSAPRNNGENHEPMEVDGSPVSKKEKGKVAEKGKASEKVAEKEQLCNGQDPSEDEGSSQDAPTKVNGKKDEKDKGETNGIEDNGEDAQSKDDSMESKEDDNDDKELKKDSESSKKDKKSSKKDKSESKEDSESENESKGDEDSEKGKDEEKSEKVKNDAKSEKAKDDEKSEKGDKSEKETDAKETNGEKDMAEKEEKEKTPEEVEKESAEKKKEEERLEEEKKKEMDDKKLEEKREKFKMFDTLGKDTEDMRPMASLLYSIGADLAKQHIFKDFLRVQTKKKAKNLFQGPEDEEQLDHLKTSLDDLVDKNKRFTSDQDNCSRCQFRTESENVMEWHLEFAHGTENNIYQCCFCEFYSKYPADFFIHVEQEHKRKGRIYMKPAFFACPLCPFEHNSKAALTKHKPKCEKNFNLKRNLEPSPTDCDIPLKKLKQLTNAKVVKVTPPAVKPVLPKTPVQPATNWQGRNANIGSVRMPVTVQSVFGGQLPMPQMPVLQQRPIQPVVSQYAIGNNVFTLVNSQGQFMLHQAGSSGATKSQGVGMVAPTSLSTTSGVGNMVRLQVPVAQTSSNQGKSLLNSQSKSLISNQAAAAAAAAMAKSSKSSSKSKSSQQSSSQNKSGQFEICEICGGFVKDRESLRIHFYWAHKVDINKELFDRKTPHLICEYCPNRFWTYQGYTRHRQMSHKVTSKDPVWKCPVCREDNISNLLTHLNQKHNISLNMICHQKYCPMCGLTFKNEVATKQHLFTAHKQMFEKAVAASLTSPSKSPSGGTNPVPTGLFKHAAKTYEPVCSICDMTFPTVEAFSMHCAKMHVFKCYRCGQKWNTAELLQAHFRQAHGNEQEKCQLCSSKLSIGRPYIRHLKRTHLKECSITLMKMPQKKYEHYRKKYLEKLGAKPVKGTSDSTTAVISRVVKNVAVARKKTTSGRADPVVIDLSDEEGGTKKRKRIPGGKDKKEEKEKSDEKADEELEDSMTMEIDGETIVIQKEDDEESNPEENTEAEVEETEKSKKTDSTSDDKDNVDAKEKGNKETKGDAVEMTDNKGDAETTNKDADDKDDTKTTDDIDDTHDKEDAKTTDDKDDSDAADKAISDKAEESKDNEDAEESEKSVKSADDTTNDDKTDD